MTGRPVGVEVQVLQVDELALGLVVADERRVLRVGERQLHGVPAAVVHVAPEVGASPGSRGWCGRSARPACGWIVERRRDRAAVPPADLIVAHLDLGERRRRRSTSRPSALVIQNSAAAVLVARVQEQEPLARDVPRLRVREVRLPDLLELVDRVRLRAAVDERRAGRCRGSWRTPTGARRRRSAASGCRGRRRSSCSSRTRGRDTVPGLVVVVRDHVQQFRFRRCRNGRPP